MVTVIMRSTFGVSGDAIFGDARDAILSDAGGWCTAIPLTDGAGHVHSGDTAGDRDHAGELAVPGVDAASRGRARVIDMQELADQHSPVC